MKKKTKIIMVAKKDYTLAVIVDKKTNIPTDNVLLYAMFTGFAQSKILDQIPFEKICSIEIKKPKLLKKGYIMVIRNDHQLGPLIEFKDKENYKNALLRKEIIGK